MNAVHPSAHPRPDDPGPARERREGWLSFVRHPSLAWVAVLIVATLSFYVHLLNDQVEQGENTRAAQRSQAAATSAEPLARPPLRVDNRAYR